MVKGQTKLAQPCKLFRNVGYRPQSFYQKTGTHKYFVCVSALPPLLQCSNAIFANNYMNKCLIENGLLKNVPLKSS